MLGVKRSDLPLDKDAHSRFLPWLIAFMVFLAVLAIGGILVLNATASRWDQGIGGTLTVQVAATEDPAKDQNNLQEVLNVIAATSGIERYLVIEEDRMLSLLEPWLGPDAKADDLPLPKLIDVGLADEATFDLKAFTRQLQLRVPEATVDDHRIWLQRLVNLIRTVELIAISILVFIALATMGTVIFTTRTGLAVHREAIEVLHLIGAQDSYIAGQFAGRAMMLGLKGGIIGLVLGIPALLAVGYLAKSLEDAALPELTFGPVEWAIFAAIPIGVAFLAMTTARSTVLRSLARML
ncbi:MAG: FtsX-like permease family protein [Rhodospirillales bacterium]|nr:FtsX-like permease family protein [Rhodospirillales bacterium]MBO6785321.1 FtsX-like permease family protein [Rhodospirillales bacterium]